MNIPFLLAGPACYGLGYDRQRWRTYLLDTI